MAPSDLIKKEDCQKILRQYLNSQEYELVAFDLINFHNPLQGLIGEHFTLSIKYKHENKSLSEDFFVKALSSNPLMLEFSKALQVYEKEEFFYRLLRKFENNDIDTSFAPRPYLFRPYITIVEDLSKDFKNTPKYEYLSLEHCHSSLAAIAKFHAASIVYEKKKGKILGKEFSLKEKYPDILEDKFAAKGDSVAIQWLMSSIKGVLELIDLLPKSRVSAEEFKAKVLEFVSSGEPLEGLVYGLLHGDLWTSNILHMVRYDKVIESKLIDFQLIKYGPLEQDVVEFLMTNISSATSDKHFDALVKHYYIFLQGAINDGLGADQEVLPPLKDFIFSCRNFQVAGKIHAVIDHSYTFLKDDVYMDVLKTEESWQKFLFEDRSKFVVDAFKKDQKFKKVLTDDLIKLRDLIFA